MWVIDACQTSLSSAVGAQYISMPVHVQEFDKLNLDFKERNAKDYKIGRE